MSQPKRGWPLRSYRPVRVSGQSMTPSLLDGDVLLVQLRAQVRPGDIVLGRFASLDLPVVKRANRQAAGGWILTSDNSRAGSDSQVYGPAEVAGVARLRLRLGRGNVNGRRPFWALRRLLPVRLPRTDPCL
jgi:hypothetical protein